MKSSVDAIIEKSAAKEYTFTFHEDEAKAIQQYLLQTQRVSRTRLPDAVEQLMYYLSRRHEA